MVMTMDSAERIRLRQLAVDTIVASPVRSKAATLAEALEKCLDELERVNGGPHCPTCQCGLPLNPL